MSILVTCCVAALLALPGDGLTNGDFEAKASKADPVPGWELSVGAFNGGREPVSDVSVDRRQRHGGRGSLHFEVENTTLAMQIAKQRVEVRPGGAYRLTAFARTKNVRRENNAKGIRQFDNSYIALFLYDGLGELVARDVAAPQRPSTDDWQQLTLEVTAPDTVRRVEVAMFLSVSGELWFDDLQLSIEGGEPVPEPARVFHDDFEGVKELSAAWLVEEGARNGGDSPESEVGVDLREGAGRSRRSLHLGGDERTLLWNGAHRWFEAAPGDAFHLSALAKAEDVGAERNVLGIPQFANLHMRLVFFDEDGEVVGAPRFAQPGTGSYDWKPQEVRAVAPEGAVRGMAGIFLSMSGDAWFDDVQLTRQTGGVPAYDGWHTVETPHLVLRHPADHPRAAEMAAYGERIEAALTRACKALDVEPGEPITMFLYRDGEQGRALTGRELDYAEPERRAVHQRPNSTLCHELVHVVALQLGYAQTGLLGEGIAVWLDGSGPGFRHDRAAELLRDGELPAMRGLLDDFRGQPHAYAAAGSFCGWLLEAHGLDAFRRLYPRTDLPAAADALLDLSWDELDAEWRAFLAAREAG